MITKTMTKKKYSHIIVTKTAGLFLLAALTTLAPLLSNAQQTTPISARITLNKSEAYEKETVFFTLTITTTSGIQFRQKLDLVELPDTSSFNLFTKFETLPVKRTGSGHSITEIHRYRCQAHGLTPGTITIAPTLKLILRIRRRGFIGTFWQEQPYSIDIPATAITIKPLPHPPANFSGAVGNFDFKAAINPDNIVLGDLVTLNTKISGPGYTDNITIPLLKSNSALKTYPPEKLQSGPNDINYKQIIIPQSTNLTAIPKISFTWFDTKTANYKTATRGPFPINYHPATTITYKKFRPDDIDDLQTNQTTKTAPHKTIAHRIAKTAGHARYQQAACKNTTDAHLAPSSASLVTFKIEPDTQLNILKKYNSWLKIESSKRRGWIPADSIK
jgi:hypothetical protein